MTDAVHTGATPHAAVAVVTRTRDRPLLLERAARSVAAQTSQDFVWVIVNDGGDPAPVRVATAASGLPASRLVVIDVAESAGMEAAANRGAAAVASRYIVLHDDDDSWDPTFLARTVGFLDSAAGAAFGGVVVRANHVSEAIVGAEVVEHARGPFNPALHSVALADMLHANLFPPISFLFRRDVWQRVGGFNPRLPVLGDWYFNIRFLFDSDIAVIPDVLAHWHHRDRGPPAEGALANSVIGRVEQHRQAATLMRNQLVRDLAPYGAALAPLLAHGVGAGSAPRGGPTGIVQPVSTPDDLSQAGSGAALLAAVVDLADRRWIGAHLPLWARMAMQLRRRRWIRRTDPSWDDLATVLPRVRLPAPPDFDEAMYLATHRDVAAAVATGRFANGFMHYVLYGRSECRLRPLKIAAFSA